MILCRHKGNKHNVFVMSHLFHKRFQALWPKIPPWYEMLLPGILCCYSQHKSTKTRKRLEQSHLHMKQFTCCRLRKGAQLLFLMKRHDYKNNWSKFGRSSVQGCLHLWTSSSKCPTQAILKSKVQGPKSKCKQANMTLIKEYSGKPFTNWPSYRASYSRFPLARFDSGLTTKTRKDTMTSEYLKGSTYLLDGVYCISWLPSECLSSVHLSIPLIPKGTCIYNWNIS